MKIGLVCAAVTAGLVVATAASAQAPTPAPGGPAAAAPTPPAPTPPATATATAETTGYVEQRLDGNQVVTFGGDPLKGDENSAYGFTLRRPPGVLRAGLIRPRVNFVSELLKSVENL